MAFFHSVGVSAIASLVGPSVDAAPAPCRCERAVVATFRELSAAGFAADAVEACRALYRVHHPDASPAQARHLVAAWLDGCRLVSAEGRRG